MGVHIKTDIVGGKPEGKSRVIWELILKQIFNRMRWCRLNLCGSEQRSRATVNVVTECRVR
jgi:hypothetical protein